MAEMPVYVYASALALAAAIPLLWRAVSAGESSVAALVRENLGDRRAPMTDVREAELTRSARERLVGPLLAGFGRAAHRVLPSGIAEALERRLAVAGMIGRWPVERVLSVKLMLAVGGFLVGLLYLLGNSGPVGVLVGLATPAVAFHLPDLLLQRRGKERQDLIRRKLPDTLDEITISVEAGLGFEAAMAEAGKSGNGPLAEEMIRTLQDIQIGMSRSEALSDLVRRTDVPDLRHFVLAVRQAEQYGVPIAKVLRIQAQEMRGRRRQRAEERAMKMPVKILIPTVFFILPALFIVILGPAVIRLADSLGG